MSVALSAAPIVLLLALIVALRLKTHIAAPIVLAFTLALALFVWRMPLPVAASAVSLGAAFALFPVAYIVLGSLFIYNLVVEAGLFNTIRLSLESLTRDRRIQALLVAYCFTAFLDSTTGFLTPVTIATSVLSGLGFSPGESSRLALLGSSMPSAFGAMGLSIVVLSQVSGMPAAAISAASGIQIAGPAFLMPFLMVCGMNTDGSGSRGWRQALSGVWVHALAAGSVFAAVLYLCSTYVSPYSAALLSSTASLIALVLITGLLKRAGSAGWRDGLRPGGDPTGAPVLRGRAVISAWTPFILLTVVVLAWTIPQVQRTFDRTTVVVALPSIHRLVVKGPPATLNPSPLDAYLTLNWLSSAGTGILVAAALSAMAVRASPRMAARVLLATVRQIRFPVITMVAMFGAAYLMNYSGMSTTLSLALSLTGRLFPVLGPLLGWAGALMIGSNTACDAWFGALQATTAARVGMSPVVAVAGNGTAAVFGKVVSPQFLAVAAGLSGMPGREGEIFRRTIPYSIGLAAAVGLICAVQAMLL